MGIDTLINLGVAIGTLAVAIVAIWGDRLTNLLNPTRARIALHNIRGQKEGDPANGGTVISYHLKVVSTTRWKTLQNCRVLLTHIRRKGADGWFHDDPFPVPRQFVWAPSELSPLALNFSKEHIFDFGALWFKDAMFKPALAAQGGKFNADVGANQALRYRLQIVADNFNHHGGQVFEVAFDGTCSEDMDEMSRHLVIRECA
jgi:hypothetical protein